jgi:hypothetical protein
MRRSSRDGLPHACYTRVVYRIADAMRCRMVILLLCDLLKIFSPRLQLDILSFVKYLLANVGDCFQLVACSILVRHACCLISCDLLFPCHNPLSKRETNFFKKYRKRLKIYAFMNFSAVHRIGNAIYCACIRSGWPVSTREKGHWQRVKKAKPINI